MSGFTPIDQCSINAIRILSAEAVQKANSGHPGLPMGCAAPAYVLWTRHLKHNPANPAWIDRDRFVLSAGHGSMLLYSLLHLSGYPLSMEDIKNFRQWGSRTPGHPEYKHTPGVETTTGPLGQGFCNGIGMAIAEKHLAAQFNKPGFPVINHFIYGIVSDGDLMEGVTSEGASLAGHLQLGNLIYLYDDNHITIDGTTEISFTEDTGKRFEAYGWQVLHIADGNDLDAIDQAITQAKNTSDKPTLIIVRTTIGFGSPNKQNTSKVHGSPLGPDELKLTKENLGWPLEPAFYIPEEVYTHYHSFSERGKQAENSWNKIWADYQEKYPAESKSLTQWLSGELPANWDQELPLLAPEPKGEATRKSSQRNIQYAADKIPSLMGGSADLAESNLTTIASSKLFQAGSYNERNIPFGIREHAMASICNGLALHGGIIPFCATFLVFSDYARPAIRLAALMGLRVIYVFTHDGIGVGEDGPTHQPVEHYMALRSIPNLTVFRPADANETTYAWKAALENKSGPTALLLTRQNLPIIDRTQFAPAKNTLKGGYILADSGNKKPQILFIATGSEVQHAMYAYEKLKEKGIASRVVSLPSWELFEAQPQRYKDTVIPPSITKRIGIESGISLGWDRYIGTEGKMIGLDHYGASAPANILMEQFGFTGENVLQTALKILN